MPLILQATNFVDKFGQSARKLKPRLSLSNWFCLKLLTGFCFFVFFFVVSRKRERYHNFDPGALLWLMTYVDMLIW